MLALALTLLFILTLTLAPPLFFHYHVSIDSAFTLSLSLLSSSSERVVMWGIYWEKHGMESENSHIWYTYTVENEKDLKDAVWNARWGSRIWRLTLILRRSRTGTVRFYTSTSNKRAARPKLYTKSLTRDLKLMYSRLTLVRISFNL